MLLSDACGTYGLIRPYEEIMVVSSNSCIFYFVRYMDTVLS